MCFADNTVMQPTVLNASITSESESEIYLSYEWQHPNFRELLHYNIITYFNEARVSNITIPRESVIGAHRLPNMGEGELRLEVEAVGRCDGKSSHTKVISRKLMILIIIMQL